MKISCPSIIRALGSSLRIVVITVLFSSLALPAVADSAVCGELDYSGATAATALITVRDDDPTLTAQDVAALVDVEVLDGALVVDTESNLTFTLIGESTYQASIPLTDGTAPDPGNGVLDVACPRTIRVNYGGTPAWSSSTPFVCDGIDVVECAGAGVVDLREIALTANSLVLNADLLILSDLEENSDNASTLKYGATITETGWTTTLTGTFLGKSLDVTYTGTVDDTSSAELVYLSYQSTGMYGTEPWTGSGLFCWDEDPVSGVPTLVTGNLYTQDCQSPGPAIEVAIGVEVGAKLGWVEVGVGISKNLSTNVASVSGSVGDSVGLASVGARFDLNQTTGVNQAYVEGEALFGLITTSVAVGDKTQAFTGEGIIDPVPVLDGPTRPDDGLARVWLNSAAPALPEGAIAGTMNLLPGQTLYDAGYIGEYPFLETASVPALPKAGMIILVLLILAAAAVLLRGRIV